MCTRRAILTRAAVTAMAVLVASLSPPALGPVRADALDDAKQAGYLGERLDGFLGIVRDDAPLSVRELAEQINAKRRAKYTEIAQRTGANEREVGILAGRKLIKEAPPGTPVMDASGRWVTK